MVNNCFRFPRSYGALPAGTRPVQRKWGRMGVWRVMGWRSWGDELGAGGAVLEYLRLPGGNQFSI